MRSLLLVLVYGLIAAAVVAFELANPEPLRSWLQERARDLDSTWEVAWWLLSDLGHGETFVVLLPTILVLSGSRRRFQDATCAAVFAGVLANLIKVLVMRDRPEPGGSYSWPSGHTTTAVAVAVALQGWKPAITAGGWLGAVGVGMSRVMRGRHWPGDVLAGLGVGLLSGWLAKRLPLWLPEWCERMHVRLLLAMSITVGWFGWFLVQPSAREVQPLIALLPAVACALWACGHLHEAWPWGTERARRLGDWALFLIVFAIGRAGASGLALLDVDEPRFATASRTMLTIGDWIVPWFNGVERFDKPVFIYWLQAAAMWVLGSNESAARLPSAFGVALAALATAAIARRLGLAPWAAWFAGLIAGTAPIAQGMAHGATADGMLYGIVTAVAWLQVRLAFGDGKRGTWWLLWLGIGIGFLTKGPAAVVAPIAMALGLWWGGARPRWATLLGGIGVALAVVAAWGVPALIQTQGGFFTRGVMYHVVERSTRPFEGHGGFAPWWLLFFFWTTPLAMLPWSLLLPWGWRALRSSMPQRLADAAVPQLAAQRLLIAWIAGVLGTFTLVVSKLPHYVLPAFPAIAIACMAGRREVAAPWLGWLVRSVGLGLGLALPIGCASVGLSLAVCAAIAVGGCLAFACWRAGGWLREGRTLSALAAIGTAITFGMTALFGRGLPMADPQLLGRVFADQLPKLVQAGETLHLYRIVAPSVTFYMQQTTPDVPDPEQALRLLAQPGKLVLMRDREREQLLLDAQVLATGGVDVSAAVATLQTPVWTGRAFHSTKGKVIEVRVYGRRGV